MFITNIKNFVTGVFNHTTKKDDVLEEINNTKQVINDDLLPSLKELLKLVDGDVKIADEAKLKKLFEATGSKEKKLKRYVSELYSFVEELGTGMTMLENVAKAEMPTILTDKTTTARAGAIMGTMTNISSVTLFIPDIILFILYSVNGEKILYNRKEKDILLGAYSYSVIFKEYRGNMKKLVTSIKHLSDTVVDDKLTIMASANDKKFRLPRNGFSGNPIYHIRLWFVDREITKYESLKDKKELTKLKIADIKARQLDTPNPSLQKQIEYYEDKLSNIEYKISQIEED
jgi:hypothetical protein